VGDREAARTAILYAFDLIEHDGEDLRHLTFLNRKAALARLLRDAKAGILLNEHISEDEPIVFAYACHLGAEGIVSKKPVGPVPRLDQGSQSRQHRCARERSEKWNR
jgi:ATP-dependent DNA ligase